MKAIKITAFYGLLLFISACQKPMPVDEAYRYEDTVAPPPISDTTSSPGWYNLRVDSITILECPGIQPYGEFPDLVFNAFSPGNFTIYNVQESALPMTVIPPTVYTETFNDFVCLDIYEDNYNSWGGLGMTLGSSCLDVSEIEIMQQYGLNQISVKSKFVIANFHLTFL